MSKNEHPRDRLLTVLVGILAVAGPVALEWFSPRVTGEATRVVLTQPPGAPEIPPIPGRTVTGRQTDRNFATGYHDPTGPFPLKHDSVRFEFEVERAGRYVIDGVSANPISQPLELWVNGRAISALAFFEQTGAAAEEHRIANNVRLVAGANTVALVGPNVWGRPFAVDYQPRKPFSFLRFAMFFFGVTLPLLGVRALLVRVVLSARARLVATCVLTAAIVGTLAIVAWYRQGPALLDLGHKHPELQRRVEAFEAYVGARDPGRDVFAVATFGDSTHYLKLPESHQMVPALARALDERAAGEYEVFGVSAGGMAAWDYYLLVNRVLAERPDLLVLPINGSAFSAGWMGNRGYWLPELERYLRTTEIPWAMRASAAGRRFDAKRLAFQRIDGALFGGNAAPFLRGLQLHEEEERERLTSSLLRFGQATLPPVPKEWAGPLEDESQWGLTDLGPDHEWFAFFHRINRLADAYGIQVLYYNVQEQSLDSGGIGPVTAPRDIDTILDTLARDSGVHVLRLPDGPPERNFTDRWIHMTPTGITELTTALANEIDSIRTARPE